MKPGDLAKQGTESGHQKALFAQAALFIPVYPELRWMHHIPNGGGRSAVTGSKLKGEGVRAGVFDVFLPVARGGYHGLYLEMKAPGKLENLSSLQREFRDAMLIQGYYVKTADNWETAWQYIEEYMKFEVYPESELHRAIK